MNTGYPTLRLLTVASNPMDVSSEQLNCRRVSATIGVIALILGASIAIPIAMLRAADEPWNPPTPTPLVTDQESTKKLASLIAAIPPQSRPNAKEPPIESQPKTGAKLQPASEQKLEWGEPVNGLRMALAWPPTLGEPAAGEVPDLYLAVQNVSEAPVRLCTTAEATMQRRLLFSTKGVAQMRTVSEAPNGSDATLGPREVLFLRLFVESAKDTEKASHGAMLASAARQGPLVTMLADMEISKAPAGAWTGMLVTPESRAGVGAEAPQNPKAQALFKAWLYHARVNGKVPGGHIARLRERVKEFVRSNLADKAGEPTAKKMEPLVSRLDGTRDWQPAEASALLSDIAAVSDSPLIVGLEETAAAKIEGGPSLGKELESAPWGEALPNGLRVACLLEPSAAEYRLGTPLKMRILIHNTGKEAVLFRARSWHQIGPKARDAQGAEIEVESVTRFTQAPLVTYHLDPDRFIELTSPGIGIGDMRQFTFEGADIASWIKAKEGDEVTLTPGPVPLSDWNEDSALVGEPRWWLDFVTARLKLASPLPANAAERTQLLEVTLRDLFQSRATPEEIATFVADREPNALESLANRLAQRPGLKPFSGSLQSGPTRFRVLAPDSGSGQPTEKPAAIPPASSSPPEEKPKRVDSSAVVGEPVDGKSAPQMSWGEAKEGLSAALRIVGELRTGGEAKAELWVRNSSPATVKFSWTHHADIGLAVMTTGGSVPAREAHMTRGKTQFQLKFLPLPAGQVVKLKEFTIRLGTPPTEGPIGIVSLPLTPGDWTLQAKWSDTLHMIEAVPEWRGELSTAVMKLQVTPEGATGAAPEGVKGNAEPAVGPKDMAPPFGDPTLPESKPAAEIKKQIAEANGGAGTTEPSAVPSDGNIVKVPDADYVKSGVAIDKLTGEGVMWNDVQNGLSLGYRIAGDEWRILGKDVKVELWVRNPGDKDVKFQLNMRPDIGLRMSLKDEKGKEHESNIVPTDVPTFGEHRLLPAGHALTMKEFTVSLLGPENDMSGVKGHYFAIDPGEYEFHCELELPGFSATGIGGKQLTPAAGEWTGKLTTRGLNIGVVAPDAPAAKPRVEHVEVGISKDAEISFDRKKVTLDELKAKAAKNSKKRFTIRADKDVSYAKVIEVAEALKAVGVVEFSFGEAQVGDGKYRVANRTGNYEFDGEHHFSICRPSELPPWFTVSWPAEGERPRCWLRTYPNVSEQARGKWAVVWEPGTDVLWWVDDTDVCKMTLTDPARVIVDREGRTNNFSRDFGLPEEVKTEFRRLGFEIGRDKTPGLETAIGGNTGGQSIVSAEFGAWSIEGTVTDADGKPLANVPVRVSTDRELKTEKTDEKGNYRADFVMLNAGEIAGELVTADGKPAPPHWIAAATPEQRPGHNAAIELSDAQGHFHLKGIPTNKPVVFTVNPEGTPGETSKSSEQKFEQTGAHTLRITLPVAGSGKGPVKIERFVATSGGRP